MMPSGSYLLLSWIVLICVCSFSREISAFNVGVKSTKCDAENDPCASLYNAVCDNHGHCKCPAGTHEDNALKTCKPGKKKGGGGGGGEDLFDDLPFEYVPGAKPPQKPKPQPPSVPVQQPPQAPRQPQPPPPKPKDPAPQGDPNIGEKAGGGVGGAIGLVAIIALVYFKCCKGGKGKEMMSKLPFFGGGGRGGGQQPQAAGGAQYQMSNQQQAPADV